MTSMSLMPPGAREWTVEDLDRMPDDGLQYELLDGLLLVTPAPAPLHQLVAAQLFRVLDRARPDHFQVSPSTRRKDRMLKRSKYRDSGVPHYWLVDPEAPSVEALRLVDGEYRSVGPATGTERVDLALPFPVGLVPAELVADPRLAR